MTGTVLSNWTLSTNLREFDLTDVTPIDIAEQELCKFKLILNVGNKPLLIIGDYSLKLKLVHNQNGIYLYETEQVKCFQNFLGLTQASISIEHLKESFESGPINIFARKATFERALSFLKIINEKSDISSVCFSISKMSSDSTNGIKNISALIAAGNKVLDYFLEQKGRFIQFPCAKTKNQSKIEQYNKSMHLDDRSIAYLCTHPESLYMESVNNADLTIGSKAYKINDVECSSTFKDTDIYENQVLLAFFRTYLAYLKSTQEKLVEYPLNANKSILYDGENYLSVDRLLIDSGLFLNIHNDKINKAMENCSRCIAFIEKNLPCSLQKNVNIKPAPTQAVLARTHYLQIFGFIKCFYELGEPQWRGQLEFFGLRNLYKIFEFLCLVNLIEAIKDKGFQLIEHDYRNSLGDSLQRPINEPNNYYQLSNNIGSIKLYYEPNAVHASKMIQADVGDIIDVTHVNNTTWTPDFVLITELDNIVETHVLDAKYSNLNSVRTHHLSECVLKYCTKMKAKASNERLKDVDSLTLLFSGDHYKYESYYNNKFSLYTINGMKNLAALKPYIGMLPHNENTLDDLSSLLSYLIDK